MEKLKPEGAMEILRQQGVKINSEQAKLIVNFLRKLAEIAVTQYLSNEDSRFIHQGKH